MKYIYLCVLVLFMTYHPLNAQLKSAKELCAHSKISSLQKLKKANAVNYPGDQNIDITYYKLDISLNYYEQQLDGKTTINFKPVNDGLNNFYLDLGENMTVTSVKRGSSSLSFTQTKSQQIVEINLDKVFNRNETVSIVIEYSGNPASDSGLGSFVFSTHGVNKSPIIWTLSEPYGAMYWFPCKNTPADKADSSDVWITADNYFVSVSNGILEKRINNANGTATYKWKNRYPIAQYLISLAMTNYELYTNNFEYAPNKSMKVYHYNYPEKWNDSRKNQCDAVIPMLEIFTEKYGSYPFLAEKYGHAEWGWGGAMEHQTISTMGSYHESIMAHELAHQWFGDQITCADWHNIWLNEGFATFSESLVAEMLRGYWAAGGYMDMMKNEMGYAKIARGSIWVQDITNVGEIFNGARSYAKGAVVLHMLRGVVGDETFFKILQEYLIEPDLNYGVAVTEDFQAIAERVYDQSLDYFFKEWIYGENYPTYSINWMAEPESDNKWQLNITVNQLKNSSPSFFTMPLEFKVETGTGESIYKFFNNAASQNFSIILDSEPTKVTFDPNIWILKDTIKVTSTTDILTITDYKLEQNYPNPFNPETTISYSLPEQAFVSIKIYDILGNEVAELVNQNQTTGSYSIRFNSTSASIGQELSSGIYIYNINAKSESNNFSQSKKMILIK